MKQIAQVFNLRNKKAVEALKNQVQRLYEYLGENPKQKEMYEVIIKPYERTRSVQQSKYYWQVIVGELALLYGFTKDEMHEYLKLNFNRKAAYNKMTGKMEFFGGSTTEMSTAEMNAYCERIRITHLAENGIYLSKPSEITE